MGLIDRGLGGKAAARKAETSAPPATIRVWDALGQMMEIPREEWRTRVLPGQLKSAWDAPEELGNVVTAALNDGFFEEALPAARRLAQIDPDGRRGAIYLAVTLLKLDQPTQAKRVLVEAQERFGADGVLLTNLAKTEEAQGRTEEADRLLSRAIELDPNQDNGLMWYAARYKDREGAEGWSRALRHVAGMPSAWRPQLWLAREALERKDFAEALALYRQVLERCPQPDAEVLMQISGDLGNNGQIPAIVELVAPRFDAQHHGLRVGSNLLKAHLQLGHVARAHAILEQLYRVQRPDWREHLSFWDGEIAKAGKHFGPLPAGHAPRISLIDLANPVWVRESLGFPKLLADKAADAPKVAFMCGSGRLDETRETDPIVSQPTDALGRLTRGLPLYLAEQAWHGTSASTSTVVPWMAEGGFVVAAHEWPLQTLWPMKERGGYVMFLHVDGTAKPWRAGLKLVRVSDGAEIGSASAALDLDNLAPGIEALEQHTLRLLRGIGVRDRPLPPGFEAPKQAWLPAMLFTMEQVLALLSATQDGTPAHFLYGERSILDALLHNAAGQPASARFRLLLMAGVECELKRRPEVVREYRERLVELQRRHPVRGPLETALTQAHEKLLERL